MHTTAWRGRRPCRHTSTNRRSYGHAVVAQQFQGMQWLHALADNVADLLASREMIRCGDAKYLDWDANVRYLWKQTFSVLAFAVYEYDFILLGPAKSGSLVWFLIDHLDTVPVCYMVLVSHMIRDGRLVADACCSCLCCCGQHSFNKAYSPRLCDAPSLLFQTVFQFLQCKHSCSTFKACGKSPQTFAHSWSCPLDALEYSSMQYLVLSLC